MNKGRRYDSNGELNKKKVAAVIIAFAVIIMFIVGFVKILGTKSKDDEKIVSFFSFTAFDLYVPAL